MTTSTGHPPPGRRRIAPLLACLALHAACTAPAIAQEADASHTYGETLSRLLRFAVVYLEVNGTLPDGSTIPQIEGTGFFVTHDGHLVTAKHVAMSKTQWRTHQARLDKAGLKEKEFVRANFTFRGRLYKSDATPFELQLLDVHDSADIAVLKLKTETDRVRERAWPVLPIAGNLSAASANMRVAALGFPHGLGWAERYSEDFSAKITFYGHRHEGADLVATNTLLQAGTSGGPVYNRRGEVVGVIYGGRELNPTSFFTPGNLVAGFLGYLGINYLGVRQ